jgi:hypothetical protein
MVGYQLFKKTGAKLWGTPEFKKNFPGEDKVTGRWNTAEGRLKSIESLLESIKESPECKLVIQETTGVWRNGKLVTVKDLKPGDEVSYLWSPELDVSESGTSTMIGKPIKANKNISIVRVEDQKKVYVVINGKSIHLKGEKVGQALLKEIGPEKVISAKELADMKLESEKTMLVSGETYPVYRINGDSLEALQSQEELAKKGYDAKTVITLSNKAMRNILFAQPSKSGKASGNTTRPYFIRATHIDKPEWEKFKRK